MVYYKYTIPYPAIPPPPKVVQTSSFPFPNSLSSLFVFFDSFVLERQGSGQHRATAGQKPRSHSSIVGGPIELWNHVPISTPATTTG